MGKLRVSDTSWPWQAGDSSGNAYVRPRGATGINKDRYRTGIATSTAEKVSWAAGEGPTSVKIKVLQATPAAGSYLKVCFDAPSDAVAANWLTAAVESETLDVEHRTIFVSSVDGRGEAEFEFTAPLENIYALASGSTFTMWVEGN